jgi:hypothetical protein
VVLGPGRQKDVRLEISTSEEGALLMVKEGKQIMSGVPK